MAFIQDEEQRANTNRRGRSLIPCDSRNGTHNDESDRLYRKKHTSSPMRQYSAINAVTNRAEANQNKSTVQSRHQSIINSLNAQPFRNDSDDMTS